MRRRWVPMWMIMALGLLPLGGCSRATGAGAGPSVEVNQLRTALAETEQQRNQLLGDVKRLEKSLAEAESSLAAARKQVQDLTASQSSLEKRVSELAKSRDDLQTMVGGLIDARGLLEKQVADLTKARDASRGEAQAAAVKIDQLSEKLRVQGQQMTELQEQIKTIRSVLQQVQQKGE